MKPSAASTAINARGTETGLSVSPREPPLLRCRFRTQHKPLRVCDCGPGDLGPTFAFDFPQNACTGLKRQQKRVHIYTCIVYGAGWEHQDATKSTTKQAMHTLSQNARTALTPTSAW